MRFLKHSNPLVFAAVAAVLFATGGLGIKLTKLSGLELSSARSLVAVATLLMLSRVMRVERSARADNAIDESASSSSRSKLLSFLAAGRVDYLLIAAVLFYAGTLALFVQATKLTTAANAIFLQYTAPVYVLLLEPLLFEEKYHQRDFVVVIVCLFGMSLFFMGEMAAGDVRGNVIALISGLCYAVFTLLLRLRSRVRQAANQFAPVIYGNLFLGLILLPFLIKGLSVNALTMKDALIVFYLGAFQIGLAYAFFTTAIARGARSLDIFIIGYVEPILNPVLVLLVIGERPNFYALLGGAIIIGAAFVHGTYESKARRALKA